jgi:DNA-binding NtrC family response regulator
MARARDRILLVEDDPDTRELMAELLADTYEVIPAADAEEALQRFDEGIRLVVTDESLPGQSGSALAIHLKEISPTVRVILVTGFRIKEVPGGAVDGVLEKPVTLDGLFSMVARALERPSPRLSANLASSPGGDR